MLNMANRLRMAKIHSVLTLRARGWSYRRIARELGIHRETVGRYVQLVEQAAKSANAPPGPEPSKPANALTGLDDPTPASGPIGSEAPKPANALTGLEVSKPANAFTGSTDPPPVSNPPPPAVTPSASNLSPTSVTAPVSVSMSATPAGADRHPELAELLNIPGILPPPERAGPASGCEPYRQFILAKLEQGLSAIRIHQDLAAEHGAAVSYHSVRRFVNKLKDMADDLVDVLSRPEHPSDLGRDHRLA
jgi:hypothetical protein